MPAADPPLDYYLWNNGHEKGPFSAPQIEEAILSGEIKSAHLVRTGTASDWKSWAEITKPARSRLIRSLLLPPAAPPTVQTRPQAYLTHLRANSCYRSLRDIVQVLFVLSLVATLGFAFLTFGLTKLFIGIGPAFEGFLLWGSQVILLIASRHFFILLIDIADTLVCEHSRQRAKDSSAPRAFPEPADQP